MCGNIQNIDHRFIHKDRRVVHVRSIPRPGHDNSEITWMVGIIGDT
ncbi:MAG TPA: hypothetical protein VMW77_09170 [Methanoregula sp.]|nr:hypothetical protein [Methanoregula sp.]